MSKQQSEFRVYPKTTATFLGWVIFFLVSIHLITHLLHSISGSHLTHLIKSFFDLDTEKNAPTFFSIGLFVINALLFLMVWKAQCTRNKSEKIWIILSGLFCFLALDELSSFHERLIHPLRSALGTSGFFTFAWIIPYSIAILLLSIFVIPIIWRIEKKIRFWFILSAMTFITGAIGFEMLGGWRFDQANYQEDILFYIFFTFEETLEMAGLVMLVYALLSLLQTTYGGFSIQISGASSVSLSSSKSD